MNTKDYISILSVATISAFFIVFALTGCYLALYQYLRDTGITFWQVVLLYTSVSTILGILSAAVKLKKKH
jgi:hypothetical protein